jgi:hypothetical protein
MAMNRSARLEAIKREIERQDRQWAQAMNALVQAGDAPVAVPQAWLDAMDDRVQPPTASIAGVRV